MTRSVILPSAKQNHGPRIAALPKVRLIEAPELSEGAWFPRCTVLSDAATAAPSFVAGALGELAPNYVCGCRAGRSMSPGDAMSLRIG